MSGARAGAARFVLRMAAREVRAAWRRLLFFFLGVALGVAAVVLVRSLLGGVRASLAREARTLTAADLVVQAGSPLGPGPRATLERRLAAAPVLERTETIATASMVRPADPRRHVARLCELRAVQPGFPFYGKVELQDGRPYSHALVARGGVLVAPELEAQLGLRPGDGLLIGDRRFTVRGVVTREPGRRPSAFSLGPRVLLDYDDLRSSGLLGFGSRARYQLLLRVAEPGLEPLARALREDFRGSFVSVRSFRDAEGQLGDGLRRLEGYLGLVAFVILVLGGIGVGSVVRVFVEERLRSIAVLKCLGARTPRVLGIYLAQVLGLGSAGGLAGVALAGAALALVPRRLAPGLPEMSFALTSAAVFQGLGTGVLVALLFSLSPLLEVRRVKPLLLLRHETGPRRKALRDPARLAVLAVVAAALGALSAFEAGSLRAGLLASAGLAAVALALSLCGTLLVRGAARLGRRARFPLRQAVLHLGRPGNQTRPVLLSVGLGAFFILTVQALERDLVAQLAVETRPDAPDLFLLDVQPDQAEAVGRFLERATGHAPRLVPVLRARVTGVRGRELNLDSVEDVRGRGALSREYVVTARERLEPNERVLAGRFWGPGETSAPEVSIEQSLRRRFGLQLGDEVRFDVLGRVLAARVTSVRAVDWSDARSGGFMFLFRPGSLRGAPVTYLGFARAPQAPRERARLQGDLAEAFPNVSTVDLRDVLSTLGRFLGGVSLAVSAVGGATLASGVLILLGSVAVTRERRRYEAAVLRTLGARTRSLAALLFIEHAVLGAVAGLAGALGSLALSAAVERFVLDLAWTPALGASLAGVALTAAGVSLVGTLASLDVLRRKPLGVLRAE